MKLILCGGGSGQQSKGTDSLFASLFVNKEILYIPVAMERNKHPYDECLVWMKNNFASYGDFQITLLDEKGMENISYEEMIKYGGIFIGGGNTFKLLKIIRETGFKGKLEKLVTETDIPVLGGSAGALIFAKSIETAEPYDPNNFEVTDFKGMNLINEINIWVHYANGMDDLIMEYTKRLGTEIIAIPEDSGLFIDNGKISVTGDNSVKKFPTMEIIEKGKNLIEGEIKIINNNMTDEEKRESVKKDYDLVAEKYNEYWGADWENKSEIDKFISLLKPGCRVLDIGSGTGYITEYMQKKGLDPVGIDFSQKMLDIAIKKYPELTFVKSDAIEIGDLFEADSFDGAIASYSLFYVPRAELPEVLNQIHKILKPNSPFIMIMQEGNGETFVDEPLIEGDGGRNTLFCNLYSKEELEELLLNAKFEIKDFIVKKNIDPGEVTEGDRFITFAVNKK